jgi:hypothetical protein
MPVRRLKKNYKNVTGLFFSKKLGRLVQFDSMLERYFILLLDFHPAVESFSEQPMRICWVDNTGEHQSYVPDFYLSFRGGKFLGRKTSRPWIIETKYRSELVEDWEPIRRKVRAGFSEARHRHCTFHIVTEDVLQTVPMANALFLRKYLNCAPDSPADSTVLEQLLQKGSTSIESLVESLTADPKERDTYMQAVWTTLARGLVKTDFEKPLSPRCEIWLAHQV